MQCHYTCRCRVIACAPDGSVPKRCIHVTFHLNPIAGIGPYILLSLSIHWAQAHAWQDCMGPVTVSCDLTALPRVHSADMHIQHPPHAVLHAVVIRSPCNYHLLRSRTSCTKCTIHAQQLHQVTPELYPHIAMCVGRVYSAPLLSEVHSLHCCIYIYIVLELLAWCSYYMCI